jgi:hypothetical protein
VKGGQLSGSFMHKQIFGSIVSRQGTISGRVSDDGRIIATATGKSHDSTENSIIGLGNCPLRAEFNGRIVDKTASGAFNTWDERGREYITCKYRFSWQATRR